MSTTEIRRSGTRDDPTVTTDAAVDITGRTIEGYASVFGKTYKVTDALGTYTEVVRPGAFAESLRTVRPIVQLDHGHNTAVGSLPIGKLVTASEDSHGLYFRAELFDVPALDHLRAALAAGAINGASFRFSVPAGGDKWTGTSSREILRANVVELGPTVWPASPHTSVTLRSRLRARTGRTDTTPAMSGRARRYAQLYASGVVRWNDIPTDVRTELTSSKVAPRIAAAALASRRRH